MDVMTERLHGVSSAEWIETLEKAFADSTVEFARAYYLFATAKLKDTYNSEAIYARYPILSDASTFGAIQAHYQRHPEDEASKRLFTAVFEATLGNRLASQSDEIQNLKNQLKISVAGLNLRHPSTQTLLDELLYEDVAEWLKKIEDKTVRETLYQRMANAYQERVAPRYIALLQAEDALMAELGYPQRIPFYSETSGHRLAQLGVQAERLLSSTNQDYHPRMASLYQERTGLDFEKHGVRADISYVMHGKNPALEAINSRFSAETLVPLAQRTFDQMGLHFSTVAQVVDYRTLAAYEADVEQRAQPAPPRILLDVSRREGKRSRAYVYPARIPSEVYLSVKPEGGLDDYSAFFHESGHALHFANTSPSLRYALALMGNNTVTEAYAYLFQNLFLNRHWLQNMAGLSHQEALLVVRKGALNDLYMLRRYASKMRFELHLFDGSGYSQAKADRYAQLLTEGTGYRYEAEGWVRDVDAGFYVADYFTAWTLEAQLRLYLGEQFGSNGIAFGEDWYQNPEAGAFLQSLWQVGNLSQAALAQHLNSSDPTDVSALLSLMDYNLNG
ncbi:MAG: M3 family metallopeptidase [Candidatus Melainabacteria bacterium]|nr:M3 family metallopeptidase [Candidatus Melainabacteria bacterium]